ncbi:hypothetical protein [Burkholderia cenocepacia]|uniref:hypothetical protein n=1 Tax=Burkholderia cenocepacia TaxID=95486 RepID=UPI000D0C4F0E|nr:hypothetical protein [Burkholderia cenocepacia]SOT39805.1 hypothetical protein F01_230149 [Burkholderia cenocepacia]
MNTINNSLKSTAAAFDAVWALRDRRNAIDAEVADLQRVANKLAELANRPGTARRELLIARHTSTMHAINNLLGERRDIVDRIAPASSHATGIANAAASRIAA